MPRFLSCAGGDKNSLKLAWLFMFTSAGAPCIYYGDEIGLDGGHDPDCRKSFPWDESKWDKDLLNYVKACIALRKEHSALTQGEYKRLYAEGDVMAFSREGNGEKIITIFNVANEERTIHLDVGNKVLFGEPKISGNEIKIAARSGVVVKPGFM
jgi:glycosidase